MSVMIIFLLEAISIPCDVGIGPAVASHWSTFKAKKLYENIYISVDTQFEIVTSTTLDK